jgi:hypothetical protein
MLYNAWRERRLDYSFPSIEGSQSSITISQRWNNKRGKLERMGSGKALGILQQIASAAEDHRMSQEGLRDTCRRRISGRSHRAQL